MVEIPLGAGRHKALRMAQHRPGRYELIEAVRPDQAGRLKR